jgi:hypothetical protein
MFLLRQMKLGARACYQFTLKAGLFGKNFLKHRADMKPAHKEWVRKLQEKFAEKNHRKKPQPRD